MSASPTSAIMTASPAPAPSSPPPTSSHPRGGCAAFGTHLQDAQRQQTANTQTDSNNTDGDANPGSAAQIASPPGKSDQPSASTAQATGSGTDTSAKDATDDGQNNGQASTATAGSLTSTVLSLIDQSTGDASTDGATATAGQDGKSTSGKSKVQASLPNGTPPNAAQHVAAGIVPVPVVPQAIRDAAGSIDANSGGNGGGGVQAAGGGVGASMSALAANKAAITSSTGVDTDADNSTAGDSSGPVQTQATGDGTQAATSSLFAATHMAAVSAMGLASTNTITAPSSTPDLPALRNVLNVALPATAAAMGGTTGYSLTMGAPVGSSDFAHELGQQVSWLSRQDIKQAQIRLNPQDLGQLDVKVSLEHGRVDVSFMAQHPEAVAAVQQGLGQLNQMLGSHGLSLGHATVGQHGAQQQFGSSQQQASTSSTSQHGDEGVENSAMTTLKRVAVGLVDAFA